MTEDRLLTAEEVTRMLGFTNVNTVWRLARARKLDIVVFGTRRRFQKSVVDKYIQDHVLPANIEPKPITQEAVDKFIKDHTLEAKS
jgi:excisionase family DNA binding protein